VLFLPTIPSQDGLKGLSLLREGGLLADIAAADRRMHAKLLTTTRCPVRFNLECGFFPGSIVPGGVQVEVHRSFVGRPSLRNGLHFLRMTSKDGGF
jgi:hypothetical protein